MVRKGYNIHGSGCNKFWLVTARCKRPVPLCAVTLVWLCGHAVTCVTCSGQAARFICTVQSCTSHSVHWGQADLTMCTRYSLPWHPIQHHTRLTVGSLCIILDRAHTLSCQKSQRDMAPIAFRTSKDVFHVFFSSCHRLNVTQTLFITSRKNTRDDDFTYMIQSTCMKFSEHSIRNNYLNFNSSTLFSSNKKRSNQQYCAGRCSWCHWVNCCCITYMCMYAFCAWEIRSDLINPVTKP